MQLPTRTGLIALRVLLATQLVIHGTFRLVTGGTTPFGGFLGEAGLPFGVAIAWAITLTEIAGGLTLIAGKLVRPLVAWFVIQLVTGIAMVHAHEGWFVVGGGRNGMEYSVVLIGGLLIVGLTDVGRAEGWSGGQ